MTADPIKVHKALRLLAGHDEQLRRCEIIVAHTGDQFDAAERELSREQRRRASFLTALAEHEPEVHASVTARLGVRSG